MTRDNEGLANDVLAMTQTELRQLLAVETDSERVAIVRAELTVREDVWPNQKEPR